MRTANMVYTRDATKWTTPGALLVGPTGVYVGYTIYTHPLATYLLEDACLLGIDWGLCRPTILDARSLVNLEAKN